MRSWEEIGVLPQYGMGLWDGKIFLSLMELENIIQIFILMKV